MTGRQTHPAIVRRDAVRRIVRSALVHAPGLYDYLSAQRRFVWMDRLGRVHDPDLLVLPRLVRGPRPLVVDVGANYGQTVLAIKRLLPGAQVVSFEPNPAAVLVLRRLQRRFPDLRVEAAGLGAQDDEASFYIPVYNGKVMTGLASFDYDSASAWLNPETILGFRPERLEVRTETAHIRRLDDYHLEPDVIKIDAQGFEDHVVAGGMQTIERARPVMFVEDPSPELVSLFSGLGYHAYEATRRGLVPSTGTRTNQYLLPS